MTEHVVNMLKAKKSLSRLVHELETGQAEEFIIARGGRPAARLVPLASKGVDRSHRIGVAKGRFTVPTSIDVLNKDIELLFEGD